METKTVYKPWGREEWIELNDKYCYKRIYINEGHRTSYQYHNYKFETNYLIEGEAEILLENDKGVIEVLRLTANQHFTVQPGRKHRVTALTDIILQEVSTPEVDDVIRLDDDAGRSSGKLEFEHMKPAVCILAAGIGSRLKHLSEHVNKSLLPLDNKAIISHLIDKIPTDYDIVVVLGYKGDMVEEYCKVVHPDRNFTFVTVDKYIGDVTGPGYSITQAKEHLQRPFIWAVADAIITDELPRADHDWLGLYQTSLPERYATVKLDGDEVVEFKNKSKDGYDYAFIGIAGVYDYEAFWNNLSIDSGEIVSAYYKVDAYKSLKGYNFDWYDIGTIDSYFKAKKIFETGVSYSIPKVSGEFLYKINNKFIKLSSDKGFIKGRIERAKILDGLIPNMDYAGEYLYSYDWIEGSTLYECNDEKVWVNFLDFMNKKMWEPSIADISGECKEFYKTKTIGRLKTFLDKRDSSYLGSHNVNYVATRPITELLKFDNWDKLYEGVPTQLFHGDLQFDNVISSDSGEFYLLDWRQEFAGGNVGDVYYDLAKMYAGILMSFKLMKETKNFECFINDNDVHISHKNESKLDGFKETYEEWINTMGYDLHKVKLITALIFLNMAPLHERKFGDLLFFKSKAMLEGLDDK